jgi:hypothetical protein
MSLISGKTQSQRASLAAPGPIGASTPNTITGTIVTATDKFLAPDGQLDFATAIAGYGFANHPGSGMYAVGNRVAIMPGWSAGPDAYIFGAYGSAGILAASDGFALAYDAISDDAPTTLEVLLSRTGLDVGTDFVITWIGTRYQTTSSPDVSLFRVGAGILGQGANTTVPQQYRIFKTYLDVDDYEALSMGASGTLYAIEPVAAGTGVLRGLRLGVSGGQVGFYGATPVARAAAIAAPTAPSASYVQAEAQSMKTAVDAIRAALTNIGITL